MSSKRRFWQISPGRKERELWPEFSKNNIIAIGWDALGNLSDYSSIDELETEVRKRWGEGINSARTCWYFSQDIKRNSIVVAKHGATKQIYGIGKVTKEYNRDDKRRLFKNVIGVHWYIQFDEPVEVDVPKQFVQWTVHTLSEERYLEIKNSILRDYPNQENNFRMMETEEVERQAVSRNWWLEKTIVKGRSDRESGPYSLGKALWSPQRDRRGADIYKNMREIKEGDLVLHLVDNKAIVGVSIVDKECSSDFHVPAGTAWDDGTGTRPGYLVTLKGYIRLKTPIHRNDFLQMNFLPRLMAPINAGYKVFYNINLTLRQGAYITKLPGSLLEWLAEIYKEQTGEELPYLLETAPMRAPRGKAPTEMDRRIIAHLATGRNIIFYGPPGTGKTRKGVEIAELFCGEGSDKFSFETANAEWTAYDVVGGPTFSGKTTLRIKPGFLTLAARKCSASLEASGVPYWLMIDEINRANLDLAFGKVFSLLDVEYRNQPIFDESEIVGMENAREYRKVTIPNDFRLLATMNTYDTALLFSLGYAFRRRFAFVEIPSPFLEKAAEDKYELSEREWRELELSSEDQVKEITNEVDDWILGKAYLQLTPKLKENLALPKGFDLPETLRNINEDVKDGKLNPFNPYTLACKLSEEITQREVVEAGYAQAVDVVKYTLMYAALFQESEQKETMIRAVDEAVKAYFVPHVEYYLPRARRKMTIGEKEEEEEAIKKIEDFADFFEKLGLIRSQRKIKEIISRLKMGETRIF